MINQVLETEWNGNVFQNHENNKLNENTTWLWSRKLSGESFASAEINNPNSVDLMVRSKHLIWLNLIHSRKHIPRNYCAEFGSIKCVGVKRCGSHKFTSSSRHTLLVKFHVIKAIPKSPNVIRRSRGRGDAKEKHMYAVRWCKRIFVAAKVRVKCPHRWPHLHRCTEPSICIHLFGAYASASTYIIMSSSLNANSLPFVCRCRCEAIHYNPIESNDVRWFPKLAFFCSGSPIPRPIISIRLYFLAISASHTWTNRPEYVFCWQRC